jgi:hypothetical protein
VIESVTDSVLADEEVVRLDREGRAGEQLRTTRELLRIESSLISYGDTMRSEGCRVPADVVEAVLAERPGIADEQAEMVRRLTTSGDGLQVVVGKAGAGKTYALDAARAAWQRAGFSVQGTALSARAAAELESGAGIASSTLASFMNFGNLKALGNRDVIVVDEAGMVGTRDLKMLVFHAKVARAAVVLTGDYRQLPEIEAGGPLRVLAERLDPIELTENRRQREGWECAALDELRDGNVAAGVVAYEEHERLHLCDSARAARVSMVADWADSRDEPGSSRMYAIARSDVEDLNVLAREELRRRGELGDDVLVVGFRGYAVGDDVLFCRNDRSLGVLNGTWGTVTAGSENGLVVETDRGTKSVGLDYLEDGHLALGYASTVHKSQGATIDRAFVLGGEALYREAGYVAMSRARERTELYVITSAFDDGIAPDGGSAGLVKALSSSKAKQLAVESLYPANAARQAVELEQLNRKLDAERPPDPSRDRRRLNREVARMRDAPHLPPALWYENLAAEDRRVTEMERASAHFAVGHEPEITKAAELETAARMRQRLLGEAASIQAPEHLVAELGAVPEMPAKRSRWQRAAGAIESFRERFGFGDRSLTLRREGLPMEVQDEREELFKLLGAIDPAYVPDRGHDRSRDLPMEVQDEREELLKLLGIDPAYVPDRGHGRSRGLSR